jgi:hypothetical protein
MNGNAKHDAAKTATEALNSIASKLTSILISCVLATVLLYVFAVILAYSAWQLNSARQSLADQMHRAATDVMNAKVTSVPAHARTINR